MTVRIMTLAIEREADIVLARQRARQLAAHLGFATQDQTRIATAVSEIARNAHEYARGGTVQYLVIGVTAPQLLEVRISDRGPGIEDIAQVLSGAHESKTGMGLGLRGAQRLMDQFEIATSPGQGTTVVLRKLLPDKSVALSPRDLQEIADRLGQERPHDPLTELRRQNQELILSLDDLRRQREQLANLNQELQDTNRGVVALYAELDERAQHLGRADELKSRFLSNMTHEFRTPLNSILALSNFLLEGIDGPLTPEQERQVTFIRKSAESLSDLVNDLLDLAKVEAGKTVVRPSEFTVENLFGALRGMLRPLLAGDAVQLIFDDPKDLPALFTDESKVSQVLRNFISNALKFTERGEVRVSAAISADGQTVTFAVSDTGIGIAAEHHAAIFDEFSQIESPIQRRVKGTGLGLPLSKRLAELLGGSVSVSSEVGKGSTFRMIVPAYYRASPLEADASALPDLDPDRIPVLVVEDNPADLLTIETMLRRSPYQVIGVRSVAEAQRALVAVEPKAVLLDVLLGGQHAWQLLSELKRAPGRADIPIIMVTSVDDRQKAMTLGADAFGVKPVRREWLLGRLDELVGRAARKVLLIEDDEVTRYVIRQYLSETDVRVAEAASGAAGLKQASEDRYDAILLDLDLPDLSGYEVLDALARNPALSGIPVVVVTSATLGYADRARLKAARAIVPKGGIDRDSIASILADVMGVPVGVAS